MLYKTKLNKELFYTAIATILILTGVVVAQRIVYVFRLAAKGIIPNDTIDTILVFNLLKHLPLLLSITLFLTILMALSRWYKDSGNDCMVKFWIKSFKACKAYYLFFNSYYFVNWLSLFTCKPMGGAKG